MLRITVGPFQFHARFEDAAAPQTCAAFRQLLPYRQQIIHARWSGEACWIPLGDFQLGVTYENHTSHPSRGDILFYPGGISEMGQLAGNHFITLTDGHEQLAAMGRMVLWQGAQPIQFETLA